jgi:hypothetical protein
VVSWFDLNMRGPLSATGPQTFLDTVLRISDEFITPAAATRAQQSFDRVKYSRTTGVRAYMRELEMLSHHVFLHIDKYSLRRQLVAAIPQTICRWLIEHKNMSTTTSSIDDWIVAVERRERELLEQEAYDSSLSIPKKAVTGASRSYQSRTTSTKTRATTNEPTPESAARTSDRGTPSGPTVPTRAKVPLAEVICHACGLKGHYKGSRECPKTPTSARLHALGVGEESEPEVTYDGADYHSGSEDRSTDPDTEGNHIENTHDEDMGTTVASILIDDDSDNIEDDIVVYTAAMTNGGTRDDTTVVDDLLKSVKEKYEIRGSGIKPRLIGKTTKQLKANSQQSWASNVITCILPGFRRTNKL